MTLADLETAKAESLKEIAAAAVGGRHPAPWRPAFRGMRGVDYVSGAAIMLATSLRRELGGFDEAYAPAYYEDSDLAFRVRAHGLRVETLGRRTRVKLFCAFTVLTVKRSRKAVEAV